MALLTGGSTRQASTAARFGPDSNVLFSWQPHGTKHRTLCHVPQRIQQSTASVHKDLSIFAVANGLSIQTAEVRKCFVMKAINQPTSPITESIPLMQSYLEVVWRKPWRSGDNLSDRRARTVLHQLESFAAGKPLAACSSSANRKIYLSRPTSSNWPKVGPGLDEATPVSLKANV